MTVTTLQTILITALIATWLVFSIVFLISSIQSFFNDRKREKREEESAARAIIIPSAPVSCSIFSAA